MKVKGRHSGKVVLVSYSDPHNSPTSPESYKIDYTELIAQTIRSMQIFAEKIEADAILCPGDYFHRKKAQNNPHHFVADHVRLLKETNIPTLGIAGNHDVKWGSADRGLRGQPLDVLIAAGVYHDVEADPYWIETWGVTVKIGGAHYEHGLADTARAVEKEGADYLVTLGHFWFGKVTGEMFGEPMYGPDVLGKTETDIWVIGHHHEDQGIQKVDGKTYVVPGALTRTGAHPHDQARRPAGARIEIEKGCVSTTVVRPKFPTAEESLDLERAQKLKEEREELDQFTQALREDFESGQENPLEVLDGLELSIEVKERTKQYLRDEEPEPVW